MGEIISREEVNRSLGRGVVGIGTGVGLWILGSLPAWSILWFQPFPIAVGAVVAMVGFNTLKKNEGALGGLLAVGAGVLAVASGLPILSGLGDAFLGIGGVGALIYGGLQLWRFFKGLKSRGS